MTALDPQEFRRIMGSFATGVAVVTATSGPERHGMTINALTSVSLDPLLLLICLAGQSRTAQAIVSAGQFALNLLAEGQEHLSRQFVRRDVDRFAGIGWRHSDRGLPLLDGALAHLECRVDSVRPGGDHVIILGEVVSGEVVSGAAGDAMPLLFYRGGYGRWQLSAAALPPS